MQQSASGAGSNKARGQKRESEADHLRGLNYVASLRRVTVDEDASIHAKLPNLSIGQEKRREGTTTPPVTVTGKSLLQTQSIRQRSSRNVAPQPSPDYVPSLRPLRVSGEPTPTGDGGSNSNPWHEMLAKTLREPSPELKPQSSNPQARASTQSPQAPLIRIRKHSAGRRPRDISSSETTTMPVQGNNDPDAIADATRPTSPASESTQSEQRVVGSTLDVRETVATPQAEAGMQASETGDSMQIQLDNKDLSSTSTPHPLTDRMRSRIALLTSVEDLAVELTLESHEDHLMRKTNAYTHAITAAMQAKLKQTQSVLEMEEKEKLIALRRQIRNILAFYHEHEGQIFDVCQRLNDSDVVIAYMQQENAALRRRYEKLLEKARATDRERAKQTLDGVPEAEKQQLLRQKRKFRERKLKKARRQKQKKAEVEAQQDHDSDGRPASEQRRSGLAASEMEVVEQTQNESSPEEQQHPIEGKTNSSFEEEDNDEDDLETEEEEDVELEDEDEEMLWEDESSDKSPSTDATSRDDAHSERSEGDDNGQNELDEKSSLLSVLRSRVLKLRALLTTRIEEVTRLRSHISEKQNLLRQAQLNHEKALAEERERVRVALEALAEEAKDVQLLREGRQQHLAQLRAKEAMVCARRDKLEHELSNLTQMENTLQDLTSQRAREIHEVGARRAKLLQICMQKMREAEATFERVNREKAISIAQVAHHFAMFQAVIKAATSCVVCGNPMSLAVVVLDAGDACCRECIPRFARRSALEKLRLERELFRSRARGVLQKKEAMNTEVSALARAVMSFRNSLKTPSQQEIQLQNQFQETLHQQQIETASLEAIGCSKDSFELDPKLSLDDNEEELTTQGKIQKLKNEIDSFESRIKALEPQVATLQDGLENARADDVELQSLLAVRLRLTRARIQKLQLRVRKLTLQLNETQQEASSRMSVGGRRGTQLASSGLLGGGGSVSPTDVDFDDLSDPENDEFADDEMDFDGSLTKRSTAALGTTTSKALVETSTSLTSGGNGHAETPQQPTGEEWPSAEEHLLAHEQLLTQTFPEPWIDSYFYQTPPVNWRPSASEPVFRPHLPQLQHDFVLRRLQNQLSAYETHLDELASSCRLTNVILRSFVSSRKKTVSNA